MNTVCGSASIADRKWIAKNINKVEAGEKSDMQMMVLKHIEKHPVMSDACRARQLNISKNTVRKWRDYFGVPPLLEKRCHQCGQVKRATHTVFEVIDYGDGYKDVCFYCANRPEEWHHKVEAMFRRVGW